MAVTTNSISMVKMPYLNTLQLLHLHVILNKIKHSCCSAFLLAAGGREGFGGCQVLQAVSLCFILGLFSFFFVFAVCCGVRLVLVLS